MISDDAVPDDSPPEPGPDLHQPEVQASLGRYWVSNVRTSSSSKPSRAAWAPDIRAGISLMAANDDFTFHCAYKPSKNAGAMNRKYMGSNKIICFSHF